MAKIKSDILDVTKTNKSKGKNINKLLNFYKIAPNEKGFIVPTKSEKDKKGNETGKFKPINMPSAMTDAYNYLIANMNQAPYMDNGFRFERYKDVIRMCSEEPVMITAKNIYISEAYNTDDGKKPIEIHAKKEVENDFYEWYNNVGYSNNFFRNVLDNLITCGDAFWVREIDMTDNKGVIGVTSLDPFLIQDRLEFNLGMDNRKKSYYNQALNISNSYQALKDIFDTVTNENLEDISQYYKSFLLGYVLKISALEEKSDKAIKGVPPWVITHCRLFTTDKTFFPFGRPMLFDALYSYKSYRTTWQLVDMLRCATFPREHITIKGEDTMTTFTRQMRVDEARLFLENVTPQSNGGDSFGVGAKVYDMEGLCEYDLIDPDVDMEKLGDLELKRTDMIMATGIPDSYLNPSEGAGDLGGENAENLKFLSKIFQKRLDSLKNAILEGVTEDYRMNLMLQNKFDGDKTEFELSMPVNIEDYTSDKVGEISDIFDLAKDIIDAIASCAGLERGESIDKSIVKDILRMYLPLESDTINKWINAIYKDAEEQGLENQNKEDNPNGENVIGKKGNFFDENKKLNEKLIKEKIENFVESGKLIEEYFRYKKSHGMLEGRIGNRIYYNNSYKINKDYKYSSLGLLKEQININKIDKSKRLEEKI